MTKVFSPKDIDRIKRYTDDNYHTWNYIFIANKIHSPLKKIFEKIDKGNTEGMDAEMSNLQYRTYEKLMKELKEKHPEDYDEVHSSL